MSAEGPLPRDGGTGATTEEVELAQVLESYLADLEAGRPADPERLVVAHPAIAGKLRACLKVMNLADRIVDDSGSASGVRYPMARLDSTIASARQSALTTLGPAPLPHVQLRDLPDELEPLVQPRSAAMPMHNGAALGRYQLQGEIGRGGMGAIIKGRDVDLGRELAIKVLLESHEDNPEVVSRFVEEAQIGGQLQHPGIVPVYELGTFPDRRPFFAMKLVKGRTLASLLHERTSPAQDLPRFVSIFEQICQTMAYAHARGVIHRDLKPSNVMVGSFGEVQVMDWGLAKVLARGGIADEEAAHPVHETVVMTVRSGSRGSGESQAGSVLGTPAYMAPEQARGEVHLIDERADVFGLGAILCEILTGCPPFVGLTREEIRCKAAQGDMSDAMRRLDTSTAEAELIGLARSCLGAEPEQRPRNAGEVARRLTAYLAGVQERLRTAELARIEAQARAGEERKRRRLTVALAVSLLITAGVVGGAWAFLARQRQERAALFNQAVGEAEALYDEARRAGDDLARWLSARDAVHAIERLLADAPDERSRAHVTALVREVTQAEAAAERDQKLLASLVDIRSAKFDDDYGSATDADYAEAFREAGIDVASQTAAWTGAEIRARPVAVRTALIAALDVWAGIRRRDRRDETGARQLTEAARRADLDPWRNRQREALETTQTDHRLNKLKDLARSVRIDELPAVSISQLGRNLLDLGDLTGSEMVLRAGQARYPGDVWLNFNLAECLERLARPEEAIRHYMAARSLRPETAHQLAHLLEAKGETDQAISIFQDLARLRPKMVNHLGCLGLVLQRRGRAQEAGAALDAAITSLREQIRRRPDDAIAYNNLGTYLCGGKRDYDGGIAAFRKAIGVKPDDQTAYNNLGLALYQNGKHDEAIAEFHTAVRLKPNFAEAHDNLGLALFKHGKLGEAIAESREAIRLKPDYSNAHNNLGGYLFKQGKLDEAITEFREARRAKPDDPEVHRMLGIALVKQGKLDEAIVEFRETLRLKPDHPAAHLNLGDTLRAMRKWGEAITELREAIRLRPDSSTLHLDLGTILLEQGKTDEAIVELHESIRLRGDDPVCYFNLGNALRKQSKWNEAIAAYRTALRLKPDFAFAQHNLGGALAENGQPVEAIAEIRAALKVKPDYADAHGSLGQVLANQGKLDEAIAAYREALRLKPDSAELHCNLSAALVAQGNQDAAIAACREALRLKPDLAEAHCNLGRCLVGQGMLDEAITSYREALRYKPDFAEAYCNLGHVLFHQGRFAEALAELKRGHELGSKSPNWQLASAEWVRNAERQVELNSKLPAILSGQAKAVDQLETLGFAQLCYQKKLHGASARFWADAFQAQPKLADDMNVPNRYNAACAAALAGSGQGKDDPPLDEGKKARWRKQAVDWLKADLAAWTKIVESGPPQTRNAITQSLQHWKADTDVAGLREASALAKLPEDEQKSCRALWEDVDALLAKSQGSNPRPGH